MQQSSGQTAVARNLRQKASAAETMLWNALRDRRFLRLKFRRQAPIGPFVVDFFCMERQLILDIEANNARDLWLLQRGYLVLNLSEDAVLGDVSGALWRLSDRISPKQ